MHFVFLTRGHERQLAEWKATLLAQRFPWKRTNIKTGKEELKLVQGALRPIQIWEYVFPEESLNDVMGAMQITGPIARPELKAISWALRKALKLEQVPTLEEGKQLSVTGYIPHGTLNEEKMPAIPVHDLFVEGVACYPVGIRKDPKKEYPQFKTEEAPDGYFQEGL